MTRWFLFQFSMLISCGVICILSKVTQWLFVYPQEGRLQLNSFAANRFLRSTRTQKTFDSAFNQLSIAIQFNKVASRNKPVFVCSSRQPFLISKFSNFAIIHPPAARISQMKSKSLNHIHICILLDGTCHCASLSLLQRFFEWSGR